MKKINKREIIIMIFIFLIFLSFCYSFVGREEETIANERFTMLNYDLMMPDLRYAEETMSVEDKWKIEESLAEFDKIYKQANEALTKRNYKEYNLNATKLCLLHSLYVYEVYYDHKETSNVDHKLYNERKQLADSLFKKVGLNQDDYYFLVKDPLYHAPRILIWEYPGIVLRASLYYEQYEKGLPPLSSGSSDSASSIMHILEELMPYFLILIVAIVCLDMVDSDRKQGTLKLLLTQPKKRSVYLMNKGKLYAKKTALIIFIPLAFTFACIGVQSGFETLSSPVLAYERGLTNLKNIDNHINDIHYVYGYDKKIYFSNVLINPDNPEDMEPQDEMELIPFWKLLLAASVFTILLICFYVSLNLLLHTLISNPIIAALSFLVIAGFGVLISMPENACAVYNVLNPFTHRNPIYAITGYTGYSFLFAAIVLLLATFLVNRISVFFFKRKDIS